MLNKKDTLPEGFWLCITLLFIPVHKNGASCNFCTLRLNLNRCQMIVLSPADKRLLQRTISHMLKGWILQATFPRLTTCKNTGINLKPKHPALRDMGTLICSLIIQSQKWTERFGDKHEKIEDRRRMTTGWQSYYCK